MAAKPNDNCEKRRKALKVLGLSGNATNDEIKNAYKTLAHQCHPDKNSGSGTIEKFEQLSEAFRFLIFPLEKDGFYIEEHLNNNDNSNYYKNLLLLLNVLKDSVIRKRFEGYRNSRIRISENVACNNISRCQAGSEEPQKDSPRINQPTTGHQPKKKKQGRREKNRLISEGKEMQQPVDNQRHPESVFENENINEIDDENFYQLLKTQIGNHALQEDTDLDPDIAVQKYGSYEEWKESQKIKKENQANVIKENQKHEDKGRPRKGKTQKSFQDNITSDENATSISTKLGLYGGSKNSSPVSVVKKERQLTFENHMEKVKEAKAQRHRKESEESSSVKSEENSTSDYCNGRHIESPSGLDYSDLEHAERQLSPRKPFQQKSEKTGKTEILAKQQELERQRNWNERREIQALEAQRRRRARLHQTREEQNEEAKGKKNHISNSQEGIPAGENNKSFPEPKKIQVNVWEQRQSQQKVLHSLEPASVEEEEAMILKALELSMQEEVEQQRQILNLYTKDNAAEGTSSVSSDDSTSKINQCNSSDMVQNLPQNQTDIFKRIKDMDSHADQSKPDKNQSALVNDDWNLEIDGEMYVRCSNQQELKTSGKNHWVQNSRGKSCITAEPEISSVLKDSEVPKRYPSNRSHWQNQGARPKKTFNPRNTWNRNKHSPDYFNRKPLKFDSKSNEGLVERRCKSSTTVVNPNKWETTIGKTIKSELSKKNYYQEKKNSCAYVIPKSQFVSNAEQNLALSAMQEIPYNSMRKSEIHEEFASHNEVSDLQQLPDLVNVRNDTIDNSISFTHPTNHDWNSNHKLNSESAKLVELECKARTSVSRDSAVVVDEYSVQNLKLPDKVIDNIPATEDIQDHEIWNEPVSLENSETVPVDCTSTPELTKSVSVANSSASLSEVHFVAQQTRDELNHKLVSSPCCSPTIEEESVYSSDILVEKQSHALSSSSSEVDHNKTSDVQLCEDFSHKLDMNISDNLSGTKLEDNLPSIPVPPLGTIPFFPAPCFLPGMMPGMLPYMQAMYMQAINAQILGLIHPPLFSPFMAPHGFPFQQFQQSPVQSDSQGNPSRPQSALSENHLEASFPQNTSEEDFNTQTHLEMQRNECSQFEDPNKPFLGVPPCYKVNDNMYQVPLTSPQQHPTQFHIPVHESGISDHYTMGGERQHSPYGLQQPEEFQELEEYDYSRPPSQKEYSSNQFYGGKDGNYWKKNISQKFFSGRYSANCNQDNSEREREIRYQGSPQYSSYYNRHSPPKNWNSMHKNSKAFNRTYFDKNNANYKTGSRDFQRGSYHSDFNKEGHHFNHRQASIPDGDYMTTVNSANTQFNLNSSCSFEDLDDYHQPFSGCQKIGPQFQQKHHGTKHSKIGSSLLEKRASQEKRWQNN